MNLGPKFKQAIHGAIVAIGGAISAAIVPALNSGAMPTVAQLKSAGIIGLGAGLIYLVKNYLIGSASTPEQPKV